MQKTSSKLHILEKGMRLMKQRITAIITILCLMTTLSVVAQDFTEYVARTDVVLPAYESPLIAGSDMNNPKAPQRYEGIPNPFQGGNTNQGKFSFHQLSEDNYCTKITVNAPTATDKFPQPYMQHYEFSGRSYGKMIFDFDLMRDSTTQSLQALVFLKYKDGSSGGKSIAFVSISGGKLSVAKVTNQENFEKYQNVPVNTWYKVHLVYDIDNGTFDCAINGDEISKGVTRDDLGLTENDAYYCFRLCHRTGTGNPGGDAYVDNLYVRHDVGFDGVLLKGASLAKIDSDNAMSRRIGIKIDRYNSSIKPFKENDVVYMPLRFTADSLHANVDYNAQTGDITLTRGETVAVLNMAGQSMTVNDVTITPVNAFKLINNVTYISAEDITKAFHTNVYYDAVGYILVTDYCGVEAEALSKLGAHMDKEAN